MTVIAAVVGDDGIVAMGVDGASVAETGAIVDNQFKRLDVCTLRP